MRSMTGFGLGEAGGVRVQIGAVNHRQIQVTVRGEVRDPALEEDLRTRCRTRLRRGSITVQVSGIQAAAGLDVAAIGALWQDLAAEAARRGAPVPTLEGVPLLVGGRGATPAAEPGAVVTACEAALDSLDAFRLREGCGLIEALSADLAVLRTARAKLVAGAGDRAPRLAAILGERLRAALGQALPEDVLARECALLADRIDISEELQRLGVHLDQVGALLADAQAAEKGRNLEFLLQEVGREINTTGAKANDAGLATVVVEAKSALERMKEQAANLL